MPQVFTRLDQIDHFPFSLTRLDLTAHMINFLYRSNPKITQVSNPYEDDQTDIKQAWLLS
jgi:hypothetical protein